MGRVVAIVAGMLMPLLLLLPSFPLAAVCL